MLTTISGNRLIDFMERNSVDSLTKTMTFKELTPKALVIKLDRINNKPLYSFSKSYHKKIHNLKVPLEFNKEYYIYEEDIANFNKMEALDQLNYLDNLMYEGICLGNADTDALQALLANKVKVNIPYVFTFTKSAETNSYWLFTESNMDAGEAISIWTKPIIKHCAKVSIEIDYVPIEKKPTFYKLTTELFESFNNYSHIKSKSHSGSLKKDGFYLRINVFGKCNGNDPVWGYLFAIVFAQDGTKQVAKIFLSKQVAAELDTNIKTEDVWLINYNEVIRVLNNIIEVFNTNNRFKDISKDLQIAIS